MQHHASCNTVRKRLPFVAAVLMLLTCAPSAIQAEGAPFFSPLSPTATPLERSAPQRLDTIELFFSTQRARAEAERDTDVLAFIAPGGGQARPDGTEDTPDGPAAAARAVSDISSLDLWPAGVAAWLGLPPGVFVQQSGTLDARAEGNTASLRVLDGERNASSVWQGGFRNLLGPLRLWGDDHSVSVRQDGTGNLGFIGAIIGFDQSIALRQLGTNIADISLAGFGEANEIAIDQIGEGTVSLHVEGLRNSIHIRQDYFFGLGGDNMFRVEIDGTDNLLRVEQDGHNEVFVRIIGNDNNAALRPDNALRALDLRPGQLLQSGEGSRVSIEVQGSNNQFAGRQGGDSGSLTITQTGDANNAGVVQAGEGSTTVVTQSGNGNSVSISQ